MDVAHRDFTSDERARHFGAQRELPSALEIEQQILGALLMRNEIIDDLRVTFDVSHFKEMLHRQIFEAMQARHTTARASTRLRCAQTCRIARSAG